MKENDNDWKVDVRETINELRNRIFVFLNNLLVQRNETSIVVVTHGVWMEECFRMYSPEVLLVSSRGINRSTRRVYNCDMIAVDCVSSLLSSSSSQNTSSGDDERKFLRFENARFV